MYADKTSPCEIKAMPALPVMNVTALPGGETTVSPTTAIDNPQYTVRLTAYVMFLTL